MKRLLLVVVLIVAGVGVLGFYLGWFRFSSRNSDNKANVTLSVDKDKIQQDKDKVADDVHNLGR